jgi:hypothetical protein
MADAHPNVVHLDESLTNPPPARNRTTVAAERRGLPEDRVGQAG